MKKIKFIYSEKFNGILPVDHWFCNLVCGCTTPDHYSTNYTLITNKLMQKLSLLTIIYLCLSLSKLNADLVSIGHKNVDKLLP